LSATFYVAKSAYFMMGVVRFFIKSGLQQAVAVPQGAANALRREKPVDAAFRAVRRKALSAQKHGAHHSLHQHSTCPEISTESPS
jgi:hypothetical protein